MQNKLFIFVVAHKPECHKLLGVERQDLWTEYLRHNKDVYAVAVLAPSASLACVIGQSRAFLHCYSLENSNYITKHIVGAKNVPPVSGDNSIPTFEFVDGEVRRKRVV